MARQMRSFVELWRLLYCVIKAKINAMAASKVASEQIAKLEQKVQEHPDCNLSDQRTTAIASKLRQELGDLLDGYVTKRVIDW